MRLLELHRAWGYTAQRVLKTRKRRYISRSWQDYSQDNLMLNESRLSLTNNAERLHYLESLNSGFSLDVNSVHNSRHLWYHEGLRYQMDCTLLLVKLLNNMFWCRGNGKAHLMNPELGFPLMNYEMGYGPTYPSKGERFGRRDAQMVVHDGQRLLYFEVGHTGLDEGTVMRVHLT